MMKSRVIACLVSGLLFVSTAFPQVKAANPPSQPKAGEYCGPDADAYVAAQAPCLDYYQQLNDLRVSLAFYKRQYDDLWQQCNDSKDPNSLACKELGLLAAGRYSIAQQDYINLAQRGCVAPPAPAVKQISKNCIIPGAGGTTSASNAATQPAPKKTAQNSPAPAQQGRTPQNSAPTTQTKVQPAPSNSPSRASVGNSFQAQSFTSGGVSGSSVNTASGGAGKVK